MDELGNLLNDLKDHFNDFIGAVVPGAVLAAGALYLFGGQVSPDALYRTWGDWSWLPGLSAVFVLGHLLLGVSEKIGKRGFLKHEVDRVALKNEPAVCAFRAAAQSKAVAAGIELAIFEFHDLRSFAMSSCREAGDIGRRFMFISLFCFGSGTALWVLSILALLSSLWSVHTGGESHWFVGVAGMAGGWVLRERGKVFERRALRTPFVVAAAALALGSNKPQAVS